jgi:hypothetical protein
VLIHVIKPNGRRFEYSFPDGTPDGTVLAQLDAVKSVFGRTRQTTPSVNPDTGVAEIRDDHRAPWAFDDPACVVAEIRAQGRDFVETRRLRGPQPSQ